MEIKLAEMPVVGEAVVADGGFGVFYVGKLPVLLDLGSAHACFDVEHFFSHLLFLFWGGALAGGGG